MLKFTFYILGLLMVRHLFIRILIINLDMCLIKLIFFNEIRFNFHSFFFGADAVFRRCNINL